MVGQVLAIALIPSCNGSTLHSVCTQCSILSMYPSDLLGDHCFNHLLLSELVCWHKLPMPLLITQLQDNLSNFLGMSYPVVPGVSISGSPVPNVLQNSKVNNIHGTKLIYCFLVFQLIPCRFI